MTRFLTAVTSALIVIVSLSVVLIVEGRPENPENVVNSKKSSPENSKKSSPANSMESNPVNLEKSKPVNSGKSNPANLYKSNPVNSCRKVGITDRDEILSGVTQNAEGKWLGCVTGICCWSDPVDVGCFENGPKTEWCHMVDLPDSLDAIDPELWFFTPDGKRMDIDYRVLEETVGNLQFDVTRDLFVISHGFGGEWPKPFLDPMKDALLEKGHNVIYIRWTKGSAAPDYFKAASNTRIVGALIAKVLEALVTEKHVSLYHTTLVGFSLGAHVSGFAGKRLIADGFTNLRRIIGLDPAGPLYANNDPVEASPDTRLNKNDALLVANMHGNGEPLTHGGAGTLQPFGHVDFYANGGQVQPGCDPGFASVAKPLKDYNFTRIFGGLACSHNRNTWLFTTSVLTAGTDASGCKFIGYPCPGTDEWLGGECTKCAGGPNGLCPTPGYETDLGTPFSGTFNYGTRGDNVTDSYFCGRQWLVTLDLNEAQKGEVRMQIQSEEQASEPYQFNWLLFFILSVAAKLLLHKYT